MGSHDQKEVEVHPIQENWKVLGIVRAITRCAKNRNRSGGQA